MKFLSLRPFRVLALALCLPLFAACATGPNANPRDPLEPLNRGISTVNFAVDKAVLQPVARGYQAVVPSPVRTAVSNFFGNLRDIWSIPNNFLQAKPQQGVEMTMRVIMNILFGFGGLIDIASAARMPRSTEDFGQTMGRWGIPSGPYLVLPLLGPSTLRDTVGRAVDSSAGLTGQVADAVTHSASAANTVSTSLTAVDLLDTRARVLPATDYAEKVATDLYSFTRDAWLQNRDAAVNDEDRKANNDTDEGEWTDSATPEPQAPKAP